MGVKPELNIEQQAAAYCTKNVVVAAGAGSGKTMVLASRFAWLVTEKNYRVNEILTLTFTNKAAAQMYRRIHSMLGEIAASDNGQKGKRAQEALDDFVHARIQTLDSYSSALVKQCASRYGINPHFVIDQDRCYSLALEESLPFLISRRRHPALQRLYFGKRPDDIVQKIFAEVLFEHSRLDAGDGLIRDVKKQFDIVCTEWEKQRNNIITLLNELHKHLSQDNTLHVDVAPLAADFASGRIAFPTTAEIRKYFDLILGLSSTKCIEAAESHPLQDIITKLLLFLSSVNEVNLSKGRRNDNPVKDIVKKLRAPAFVEFSSLSVFCMQAGLIFSLLTLMHELQGSYLAKKRAEGILTFSDVAHLARTILLEQHDIRQSEKETFKAIMIDEFQDNNELQKDLLFLLAEKTSAMNTGIPPANDLSPDKLFFVGDEKQSVYLFRGADVSVFRKLKTAMQSVELPLSTNYRSAPNLIGAFNAIFGGSDFDPNGTAPLSKLPSVFVPPLQESDKLPLYEAAYTPLRAGKTGKGKLGIYIFDETSEEIAHNETFPLEEKEARFVAERIQHLLAQYQPHEIALLFRTRTHQHLFEKHLRMLNIPYTNEDLGSFFFGGPVNDIMSVLRLAAYPLDRAAYAEMLRSPFAGLSLSGLAACLAPNEQDTPFTDEPLARLSKIDQTKYLQGQKIYQHICDMAQQSSVSALVSELWYALGYRYETEWNVQTSVYRELYDYLFHLAAKADANNEGLAAFVDSIQALRESSGRLKDIEIPLERPSAVQILTIHKSKGLEFPVVFLCCCDRGSMGDRSADVYDTGDAGIAVAPPLPPHLSTIPKIRNNFFWEHSSAEAKRKSIAELRRLLYVGMTRAEKELYLTGSLAITESKKDDDEALCENDELVDFSLRVKHYVKEKFDCRIRNDRDKKVLPGDSIMGNDTFFDMVLPAFAAHIPSDGLTAQNSFFTLEEIPTNTGNNIQKAENINASLSNDQKGLNAFFAKAEKFYSNAKVIVTPHLVDNHLTPTSLHNKIGSQAEGGAAGFSISKEFSGEDASAIFDEVDVLLKRFSQSDEDSDEKFNSSSFGIIAHACAEALLNDVEPIIPAAIACFLNPKEYNTLLEAGNELAEKFIHSPLGKIAKNASMRENEFSFRTLVHDSGGKEIFVSGSIDLLFEDAETIYVVDFKTDKIENPGGHTAQMACYYRAANAMFAATAKKKCRIWLYYLRSGHAVESTERAAQFVIG